MLEHVVVSVDEVFHISILVREDLDKITKVGSGVGGRDRSDGEGLITVVVGGRTILFLTGSRVSNAWGFVLDFLRRERFSLIRRNKSMKN